MDTYWLTCFEFECKGYNFDRLFPKKFESMLKLHIVKKATYIKMIRKSL